MVPCPGPTLVLRWFLEFGGDLSNLKPGDKFTLNVSGMPVGTEIEIWMHSDPVLLGTATGTGLPMALEPAGSDGHRVGRPRDQDGRRDPARDELLLHERRHGARRSVAPAGGDKPLDTDPTTPGNPAGGNGGGGSGRPR